MALLYRAKLDGTDASTQTGGTVSAGTLAGWVEPFATIAADGLANANHATLDFDLPVASPQLIVRAIIEMDWDFANTGNVELIRFENAAGASRARARISGGATLQLAANIVESPGYILATAGNVPPGHFVELWLAYRAGADGAARWALGGQTRARSGSIVGYSQTDPIAKVRVGLFRAASQTVAGKMYIHAFEVYDSQPTGLEWLHSDAEQRRCHGGSPAVVDIVAPPGGTVEAIEIRQGSTIAPVALVSASALRPARVSSTTGATITDASLDVASGTYDGCIIDGTAGCSDLFPGVQILEHRQLAGDVGSIDMVSHAGWFGIPEADTVGNTVEPQTFAIWRAKEIEAGTYRIALPGSAIPHGRFQVAVTIDGTEYVADRFGEAIPRGERTFRPQAGRVLVMGADDASTDHPALYRHVFAHRHARPFFAAMAGTMGSNHAWPWSIARTLKRIGCDICSHGWTNARLNEYATDAEAARYLRLAKMSAAINDCNSPIYVPSGGVFAMPQTAGTTAGYQFILDAGWMAYRGSDGHGRNAQPMPRTARFMARSVNNTTSGESTWPDRATDLLDINDPVELPNNIIVMQVHSVGDTVSGSFASLSLINELLDQAEARGIRLMSFEQAIAQ